MIDHNHHIGRTAFGPFELRWSETPADFARLIEAQADVVVLEADREGGAATAVEPDRGAQHQEVRS